MQKNKRLQKCKKDALKESKTVHLGKKYFLQGIWIRVNKRRSTKWIDVC